MKPIKAIYVSCDNGIDYSDLLLSGKKTIETRTRNVFKKLLNGESWVAVAVIRTGKGKPTIVGTLCIHMPFKADRDDFCNLYNQHKVKSGSKYDCSGDFKWMYPVSAMRKAKTDLPLSLFKVVSHGRSWCELY